MVAKDIARDIIDAFTRGKKLIVIGNGGSSSLADHLVGELSSKFKQIRKPLPAIAFTSPTSITAIGNDFSFDVIFARQISGIGKKGDILITLSTSGTSPNILLAQQEAKKKKMKVIAFPTNDELGLDTPRTQEAHLRMIHDVSELVENSFYEK